MRQRDDRARRDLSDGINLGGRVGRGRWGPPLFDRHGERNGAVKLINDAAADRRRLLSRRAAENFNLSDDFQQPRGIYGGKFAGSCRRLVKPTPRG